MSNGSSITQFLLLAFTDMQELQLLHFWLFLGIYLAALLGNGLIITAVACNHCLHTHMYFFLLSISVLDLGSISTTLPKGMANSLGDTRIISFSGCSAQVFFFLFLMSAEFFILTVMAYNHYIAICHPLHYGTLLGSRTCAHMAAAAWGSGFLSALLHIVNIFSIPLCKGNALEQFFCEVPKILKLACSHSYLRDVDLAMVSLFISTGMFAYFKPLSISSTSLDLVVAVLYSVLPPAVNPLIYSTRNQELRDAIKNVIPWTEKINTSLHNRFPKYLTRDRF